jgi:hypothetical protein
MLVVCEFPIECQATLVWTEVALEADRDTSFYGDQQGVPMLGKDRLYRVVRGG